MSARTRAACPTPRKAGSSLTALVVIYATASLAASQVRSGGVPRDPADQARASEVISVILLRGAACDRLQPGFRDLSARAFARWRRFGLEAIAAVEASPEFQARLAEIGRFPGRGAGPRDRRDAATLCGDQFIAQLETLGRDADPRLATPEGTWRTFVAALQAGDRQAALAAMTDTGRDRQRRRFEEQSPGALRDTGNAFAGLEFKQALGPFRVAVATRRDGGAVTIFFERSWNGDWRIASI